MTTNQDHHGPHHDWQSAEYVQDWISNDVTKDEERKPILRRMMSLARLDSNADINVLDVGAGYGIVTSVVLETFPRAHVTLQDFSAPMLEHARQRLAPFADATAFVQSDLRDEGWVESVGGPFDLAVSAIAIHNLGEADQMAEVYRHVQQVLKPGGIFLDCDYTYTAGLDSHVGWLRQAGFGPVTTEPQDGQLVVFAAFRPT